MGGARRPWKCILTDDPDRTLGEGQITHHATLIDAANKLAQATSPYGTIIRDDGHQARELTTQEQGLVDHVCQILGIDTQPLDAA